MGSRNRKPSADGNRELPNSANKSPVEKAVRTEAKGGSCRLPGAAPHPMAFPSLLGDIHRVKEGGQGQMESPLFCSNPKVSPFRLRVALAGQQLSPGLKE